MTWDINRQIDIRAAFSPRALSRYMVPVLNLKSPPQTLIRSLLLVSFHFLVSVNGSIPIHQIRCGADLGVWLCLASIRSKLVRAWRLGMLQMTSAASSFSLRFNLPLFVAWLMITKKILSTKNIKVHLQSSLLLHQLSIQPRSSPRRPTAPRSSSL